MQREFADWCPGPVLLQPGRDVTLMPKSLGHDYLKGCSGTVVEHLAEDPRVVTVHLAGEPAEHIKVLYSILKFADEETQTRQHTVGTLLAGADTAVTLIGYNEFICGSKTEREYWLSLGSATKLPFKAGELPVHVNPTGRLNLCVVHVQYKAFETSMSEVEQVSLRETPSIELRAHQDKCRSCEMCAKRQACKNCKKKCDLLQAHVRCLDHDDCSHCPNFKWKLCYGMQLRNEHCRAVKFIVSRSTECTLLLSLRDARQRRFAFIVGNETYIGKSRGSIFEPLGNVNKEVIEVGDQLKDLGFDITKLTNQNKANLEREVAKWTRKLPENAEALVFLSGHGMELYGEQYFVSVDYTDHDIATIVDTAKTKCVTLKWIRDRVLSVLRDEGLIMSFWDCCREDALTGAENDVMRGHLGSLIRNPDKLLSRLTQTTSRSASQLSVFGSMRGALCHQEQAGGLLTQALLAWWRDEKCVALSICHEDVRKFVVDHVKRSRYSIAKQEPCWEWGGGVNCFTFKPDDAKFVSGDDHVEDQQRFCAPSTAATAVQIGGSDATTLTGQVKDSMHQSVIPAVIPAVVFYDNLAADAGGVAQASETSAECTEPKWSELKLDLPSKSPWPFKILFIGVNSSEKPDLNLKEEFEKMESALDKQFNSIVDDNKPLLIPIPYSTWTEVMSQVGRKYPTILHFGCHARTSGIELYGKTVEPHQMIPAIQHHNDFARKNGQAEIHVIILNACNSDGHAEKLLACVDFAIGHKALVDDRHAINFTDSFYSNIFKGMNLAGSFSIARSVSSNGYRPHAKKDPEKFCFVHKDDGDEGQCKRRKRGEGERQAVDENKQIWDPDHNTQEGGKRGREGKSSGERSKVQKTSREEDRAGKQPKSTHAGVTDAGAEKSTCTRPDAGPRCDLGPAGTLSSGDGFSGGALVGNISAAVDCHESSLRVVFPFDVFISHAWDTDSEGRDNHVRAKRLNASLQTAGFKTWFDDEQMLGNILAKMVKGIEGSAVILICVTRQYMKKVAQDLDNNCKFEFEYALNKRTTLSMLPIVMEESMADTSEWHGILSMTLGRHLYYKLASDVDLEFEDAVKRIAVAIRTMVEPQQVFANEQQGAARQMCSRSQSPAFSIASGMDTVPASPRSPSPGQQVLAMHVDNDVFEFREDMTQFMESFLKAGDQPAPRKWKLCELLLVAFMRDKVAPNCNTVIAKNLEAWQEKCEDPEENLIDYFHQMMKLLKPPVFEELEYNFAISSKQNHSSIFVIDWMVRRSVWALELLKQDEWAKKIVLEWFEPENADTSDCFLQRAENFLCKGVKGTSWGAKILGKVIKTSSYVIFFRMGALSSLLMREYCALEKKRRVHQTMEIDCTSLLSISLLVSSSPWHLSLADGKSPSAALISDIVCRLQRIDSLPGQLLEANECFLSKIKFVEWEPLYSLVSSKNEEKYGGGEWSNGDDDYGNGGGGGAGGAAAGNAVLRKRGTNVIDTVVARLFYDSISAVKDYLIEFREMVGSFHDAASGDKMWLEKGSIPLKAMASESVASRCEMDPTALQEDMRCPISRTLMQDPVKCFDGTTYHTYERSAIEMHFEIAMQNKKIATSPLTKRYLQTEQVDGKHQLALLVDEEMSKKIKKLEKETCIRETRMKKEAEGEEERRMFLRRMGYDVSTIGEEKSEYRSIESAQDLLHRLNKGYFMCMIGPPASGKTLTMFQIASTAAAAVQKCVDEGCVGFLGGTLPPRIPLFMRAAELSTLVDCTTEQPMSLEALVQLFIDSKYLQKKKYIADVLTNFLKLRRVLIIIDGLDEASRNRSMFENLIDETAAANDVCLMISTRDYAFETSRLEDRLREFEPARILPLDDEQRNQLIGRRLLDNGEAAKFSAQLEAVSQKAPEMATSPFLLVLMIEVFKKDVNHTIPTRRCDLYDKQVDGILQRHTGFQHMVNRRVAGPFTSLRDMTAFVIFHDDILYQKAKSNDKCRAALRLSLYSVLKNDQQSTESFDIISMREFLEVLAFVCQIRLEVRDFQWNSEDLQKHMQRMYLLSDFPHVFVSRVDLSTVGLLSKVGNGEFRFSHLTLQEYLAAACTVRLWGKNVHKLLYHLEPLYSRWKREVLQFTACMLTEDIFTKFCQLILESDDGTGANCQLVQDFLRERGSSENVEKMVQSKLHKIRAAELITGLCHPSLQLRNVVLSEMKVFGVPRNPFAPTDGTADELKKIADDTSSVWHKRCAAIYSLVQISLMDHCLKLDSSCRQDILMWIFAKLRSDSEMLPEVQTALVKGLGTILREPHEDSADSPVEISSDDTFLLLEILDQNSGGAISFVGLIPGALEILQLFSRELAVWLLKKPDIFETWPSRHLCLLFSKISEAGGITGQRKCDVSTEEDKMVDLVIEEEKMEVLSEEEEKAEKEDEATGYKIRYQTEHAFEFGLAKVLIGRLYISEEDNRTFMYKALEHVHVVLSGNVIQRLLLQRLESGTLDQRIRMLNTAGKLELQFGSKSTQRLVQCLLAPAHQAISTFPSNAAPENSLLTYLVQKKSTLISYPKQVLHAHPFTKPSNCPQKHAIAMLNETLTLPTPSTHFSSKHTRAEGVGRVSGALQSLPQPGVEHRVQKSMIMADIRNAPHAPQEWGPIVFSERKQLYYW